jgi:hypothetical protein
MPHLAMAFAICHPAVASALLGARTMGQLDDLLAGVDTVLPDEVLDRIDDIVPPGSDIGTLDLGSTSHRRSRKRNCAAAHSASAPQPENMHLRDRVPAPDTHRAPVHRRTVRSWIDTVAVRGR